MQKQESTLTIFDLLQFPAWEYALNEEVVHGQNEKTIRPYLIPPPLDRDKAYFIVRARFFLANGFSKIGFLKPLPQGENKLMEPLLPYDLNPVIVTDQGHVTFCYGVFKPNQVTITENYKRLEHDTKNVFPIKFMADIKVLNSITEGILEGFLYLEKDTHNFFKLKPSDIKSVK